MNRQEPVGPAIDWRNASHLRGMTRRERMIVAQATAHQILRRQGAIMAIREMLAASIQIDWDANSVNAEIRADGRQMLRCDCTNTGLVEVWIDAFR